MHLSSVRHHRCASMREMECDAGGNAATMTNKKEEGKKAKIKMERAREQESPARQAEGRREGAVPYNSPKKQRGGPMVKMQREKELHKRDRDRGQREPS